MRSLIVLLLSITLTGQALADDASTTRQSEKAQLTGMMLLHGAYRNVQYGFGLPAIAAKAYLPAPPNPNHGMIIILGNQREISISGAYDAAEYGSTQSALDNWLEGEHADSVKRETAALANQPAEQATLQTGAAVTRVVMQRRNEGGGIIYELTLTTNDKHVKEDAILFDKVLHSFRTYPLP